MCPKTSAKNLNTLIKKRPMKIILNKIIGASIYKTNQKKMVKGIL